MHPPKMTNLSTLGAYYNEYGRCGVSGVVGICTITDRFEFKCFLGITLLYFKLFQILKDV